MVIKPIGASQKKDFDRFATHPLQSWAWGEFKKKMGQKVERFSFFQVFFHRVPHLPYTIGYFPKGPMPTKEIVDTLKKTGKKHKAIFIKLEPNVKKSKIQNQKSKISKLGLRPGKPLFTRHTMIINLKKSEEELMTSFHSKTRYNIRLAQRKGVKVIEDNSEKAFEQYWQLMKETTKRQRFFAHNKVYHQKMWRTMHSAGIAHLLKATYQNKVLVAWILFVFNQTLYYPYGASSAKHRNVMASNLIMWEAIRFGKKHHCQQFDLWGTPGPNPSPNDPWYGFHRFKMGYNPQIIEFIGTYDLVLKPRLYQYYKLADKLRWRLLRLRKR